MKSIYEKPMFETLGEGLPISLGQDGCQTGSVPGTFAVTVAVAWRWM